MPSFSSSSSKTQSQLVIATPNGQQISTSLATSTVIDGLWVTQLSCDASAYHSWPFPSSQGNDLACSSIITLHKRWHDSEYWTTYNEDRFGSVSPMMPIVRRRRNRLILWFTPCLTPSVTTVSLHSHLTSFPTLTFTLHRSRSNLSPEPPLTRLPHPSFRRHKAVPTTLFSFEILVLLIDQAKLCAYPNEKTEMEILPIFSILNVVYVSKKE